MNINSVVKKIQHTEKSPVFDKFIKAVKKGNYKKVNKIIRRTSQNYINTRDNDGNNALHFAINNYDYYMIEILLDNNIDVNAKNKIGKSPLATAYDIKDINTMKMLLDMGANPNVIYSSSSNVPIIYKSIEDEYMDAMSLLIEYGANINCTHQNNILHIAVNVNNYDIVEKLLETNKCDVNCQDYDGNTSLHLAIFDNRLPIAHLLINYGADLNVKNKDGNTVMHFAAINNNINVIKLLLREGAIYDIQNIDGDTPAHLAVSNNNITIIKEILKLDIDPNVQNNSGETILHIASYNNNCKIINLIIKKTKINPDIVDNNGLPAIYYITKNKCFNLLLNLPSRYNGDILRTNLIRGRGDLAINIIDHGYDVNDDYNETNLYKTNIFLVLNIKNPMLTGKFLDSDYNFERFTNNQKKLIIKHAINTKIGILIDKLLNKLNII